MTKATYGLFVNRKSDLPDAPAEIWWGGPNYPDHTSDEEERFTNYPVEVFLECVDTYSGNGWGRSFVEQHAEILNDFFWDVGSGHESQAVLVRVQSETDLLALLDVHELFEEEPEPL